MKINEEKRPKSTKNNSRGNGIIQNNLFSSFVEGV
jgi:hypothetical protein